MALIDDLTTSRTNIAAVLATITRSPKPTYSINGQQVQWSEYLKILLESLKLLNEQIQVAGGPFELQTQAQPVGGAGGGLGVGGAWNL